MILAETRASAKSIIEAFSAANVNILVQEFIKEAGGTDIRALVVGGKVVAAMQAHRHRRASSAPTCTAAARPRRWRITERGAQTALRSADALGLNVCGVDMLRSNRGPLVMEVNSSPGFRGIEAATGVDVAKGIIAFLAAHARYGETETRGNG